jgi:hypothetical protein
VRVELAATKLRAQLRDRHVLWCLLHSEIAQRESESFETIIRIKFARLSGLGPG